MNAAPTTADIRPLWHAQITALCMTQAALCRLVPWGTREIGKLPAHVISRAQSRVGQLVDAKADLPTASAQLWNDVFRELRPADWRTHPTAPGAFPIIAPRGTVPNTKQELT